MSFVNLMKNDVWSESDIVNRTEALIGTEFPPDRAAILQRKVMGAAAGMYQMTPGEQGEVYSYAMLSEMARVEGEAARADMALLAQVLAYEPLVRRLARPEETPFVMTEAVLDADGVVLEPSVATDEVNPLYEQDTIERADATTKVANAPEAVVALALLRNPPPPEVVEEGVPT